MSGTGVRQVDGFWWLAGSTGRRVHGVLRWTGGRLELSLPEGFDTSSAADVFRDLGGDLLVLGVDELGGLHSLLGCFRTWTVADSRRPAVPERWHVDVHLAGVHVVSPEESVGSMVVDISSLLAWSGLRPVSLADRDGAIRVTAGRDSVGVATVEGHEVELYADYGSIVDGDAVTVTRRGRFEVRFANDSNVTIAEATTRFAGPLDELIVLLTGHAAKLEPLQWTFRTPAADGRPRVAVHHAARVDDDVPVEPVERAAMLAPWPIEGLPFDQLITAWFRVVDRLGYAVTMVNVPLTFPGQLGETLALTAFLAVEHLHNVLLDGHADDPIVHRKRAKAIIDSAPAEHREWLSARLSGNQKGFSRRLTEIAEYAGTTGQIVTDAFPDFVKSVIATRNTVDHPSPLDPYEGERYLYLSNATRWLVRHCLLLQLGLDEPTVTTIIQESEAFHTDMILLQRMNTLR